MTTPNLALPEVSAAQDQKEVTINQSLGLVDKALTELLTADFTAGDVTLTSTQAREAQVVKCTNVGAARNLNLPQVKRLLGIDNSSGAATVTVVRGAGTVDVPPGETRFVYADGTTDGIVSIGGGGSGGSLAVAQDGSDVVATATKLNLTGQVEVTDSGGGVALINIGAAASAGAAGPWEFLGEHTLSGSDFDITALGDAHHRALMLVMLNVQVSNDSVDLIARIATGGVVRTASYSRHGFSACDDGTTAPTGNPSASGWTLSGVNSGNFQMGNAAGESLNGTLLIFDPHTTGKKHRMLCSTQFSNISGEGVQTHCGGMYNGTGSTDAITGVRFSVLTGTMTGTVLVYGLRDVNPPTTYFIPSFTPGAPTASQILLRHVFAGDTEFLENLSGSVGDAETAATALTTLDVKKNGVSIGSISFAASASTPTFTVVGGATFVAGDVLTVVAPGTPDATLADISLNLVAFADVTTLQSLWIGGLT